MSVAPVYKGHLATTNGGNTPVPVNVPATNGPAVGDWMIAVIHTTAQNATVHNTAPPADSGWIQILAPSLLSSRILQVYAKRRTATDPNTWTFTQATFGTALADVIWGSGGTTDVTTWLKGAFSKGANLTTQTTPGVSGTVTNSLAISIQAEATSATETDVMTVDSPFTKLYWTIVTGSGPINSLLIASRTMAADGATGDAVSRNWPNSTGNRGSFMLVIPPAPDTVTPITKLSAKMSDGAGNILNVGLTIMDESAKEVALAKIEPVYGGTFVPDLVRTDRVWWMAHRGGSADYQEHSLRGYVQSAIAHADVLEASIVCSSDNVFFLAHDPTADRTSSSVAGQNWLFSEHTAAEIEALVQDLPNRGDTRFTTAPYMRLTALVDQWAKSHTLMLDFKNCTTAQRTRGYTYIQTIPDYRNRIMGKFYTTGTVIADEFHAIGCLVWGYSYTADVDNGVAAATAAKWDFLGLEYTATQATWNTMLAIANGKKVLGHICPNAAAAQQAVARGAKALQVSGVNSVATVY